MVMENEIRLGDIMDKLTPSDRVVIYNAARQVVYLYTVDMLQTQCMEH